MEKPFGVQAALNEWKDRNGHRELPSELNETRDYHNTQGCECLRSFGLVGLWTFMMGKRVEKQAVTIWKCFKTGRVIAFSGVIEAHSSGPWDGITVDYEDQNQGIVVFDWAPVSGNSMGEIHIWGWRSGEYVLCNEQRLRDWKVLEADP